MRPLTNLGINLGLQWLQEEIRAYTQASLDPRMASAKAL